MKRFFYAIACVVLLIAGVFLTGKRALFLLRAEKAQGQIASISGSNDTCGSKRNRHDCTQFHAKVAFKAKDGSDHTINVSAGNADGHNVPVIHAASKIGQAIEVLYDPRNPTDALDNTFFTLWAAPLFSFVGGIFCMIPAVRRR